MTCPACSSASSRTKPTAASLPAWHIIVALESPSNINTFRFTDGNVGGTIQWPDSESPYSNTDNLDCYQGEHKDYHLEVWTRYPESVPYTGASVGAWFTPNQKQEAMKCT